MKICSKCSCKKNLSQFSTDKSHKDRHSSQCKECRNKYRKANRIHYTQLKKEWRLKNPLKSKKTTRKFYNSHKKEILEQRKISRLEDLKTIREKEKSWKMFSRYGITLEEKKNLYEKQGGACGLCKKTILFSSICIDHDHTTGQVRGLLCRTCNFALGILGDTSASLEKVFTYLQNG